MGVTLSKEDDMLDQFYGRGLRELSMNGNFSSLPEEIILHIFSFCDVRSVVEAGTLCRRLRKVASDETIWKTIFKAKWGTCRSREEGGIDQYDWREEFMNRQRFVLEKKRARADASTSGNNTSLATQIWDSVVSTLNPFVPIRKRKVVFVGLEAAGKTTCCFRLQTNGPDPNYFPIPRQCFPPIDVFQTRELEFVAWDVGGYKSKYYDSYSHRVFAPRLQECEALVFVVDASEDERRMTEAKRELSAVLEAKMEAMFEKSLNLFERDNRPFPVMVLANKQDLPRSRKADEVSRFFASCFEPYENVIWTCRAACAAKKEAECLTEAVWWLLYEMEHTR